MSGMEIPAALAIGGSAISAGSSLFGASASEGALRAQQAGLAKQKQAQLMAAREQAEAQEFEARGYDRQGTRIRSAGAVEEASRRLDLESSLETIQVLRAGRGLDLDSPTGRAIMSGVTSTAERNIMTAKTNYALQAVNSELQGELSRRKARYSLLAGEAGAAATDATIRGIDSTIDATWAAGIGKAAGAGLDAFKIGRGGGFGAFGSGGGASP